MKAYGFETCSKIQVHKVGTMKRGIPPVEP